MARKKNKDALSAVTTVTIQETIENYLEEKKGLGLLSPDSVANRRIELNRFCRFCCKAGVLYPDEIHKKLVVGYLVSLSVAKSTKVTIRQILSAFMDYLVGEGIVLDNVVARVDAPKVHPPAIDILTTEQIDALYAAEMNKGGKVTDRNLLIFSLALDLLLRVSEISRIKMEDLRLDNGNSCLFITRKGDKPDKLPLNAHLVGLFAAWLGIRETFKHADSQYVFVSTKSGQLHRKQIYSIFRVGFKQAGIIKRQVGPHTLRHTGASRMGSEGVNPKIIQYLLGHSSMNTTTRYLHFLERELVKTLERRQGRKGDFE